jgi:phosphoribosylanthranilate isomerase
MTHIKICGITNLEDGLAALELGADYLGFNFYPSSPRAIDPMHCAEICQTFRQRFPDARLVGVFVNATVAAIRATLDGCRLHLAQLHGDEPPEALAALNRLAYKAIRGNPGSSYAAYVQYSAASPCLLLDATANGAFGGTGILGDWEAAREIARQASIFLAGGLNPENVGQAIEMVRPWGVDTASGVEERPGKKDPVKMKAFIQAVHSVTC